MPLENLPIAPSANLQSVSYDSDSGDLIVSFVKGSAPYRFKQVSLQVAEGFSRADSSGKYFRASILNQYQHELVG